MGLPKRDAERHRYGEYRRWPQAIHYELIDALAYAIAPAVSRRHQASWTSPAAAAPRTGLLPATAGHDHIVKRGVYEREGVREYGLVYPVDRIVTIYRLQAGRLGAPEVRELTGRHAVGVLPQVEIDWEPIAAIMAA